MESGRSFGMAVPKSMGVSARLKFPSRWPMCVDEASLAVKGNGFDMAGRKKERGANLIEFALIAPFLIMLLFGIIEFAWVFAQNLDIRHGAREGARLAAVNFPIGSTDGSVARNDTDRDALIDEICARMDLATGVTVDLQSPGTVGGAATATTSAPRDTLTGLMDWAIPPSIVLSSTVEIRLEQPATWTNAPAGGQAC